MASHSDYCTSCGKEMFQQSRFCTYCGSERSGPASPMSHEGLNEIIEIKRVSVWSLVKLFFMLNAVFGLILGILIASIVNTGVGMPGLPIPLEGSPIFGKGIWIGAIVLFPVFNGIMGALLGLIIGVLYNLLAWGVGGIRITVKS